MKNNAGEITNGGLINEFLWICSDVNRKVLRQCPTDYAKYAGMGGTIFFTALMASLSGGYAIFTVFKSTEIAFCFGIFWGMLIFNLDRLIVNTMYSDGKVTISWKEFVGGLPRILMAIFLGIVISAPLELKIYEDGIDNEIEHMKEEEFKKRTASLDEQINELKQRREDVENKDAVSAGVGGFSLKNSEYGQRLNDLQNQQRTYSEKIRNKVAELKKYSPIDNHRNYQRCSSEIRNLRNQRNRITSQIGQVQKQLSLNDKKYADVLLASDDQKKNEINDLTKQINNLQNSIDNKANDSTYTARLDKELTGFQGRMKAFNRMKDEESSTKLAATFIMLLFIIIETAPTFLKMMIAAGSYDDLLRAEMHKTRVWADKQISDLNDDINTEVEISTEKNRERLNAELKANKELIDRIALVQSELISKALDGWRKEELEKIEKNPSNYILSQTPKENT